MLYDFPHEVIIEYPLNVSDGGGGSSKEWRTLKTTEAHVMPFRSTEYFHMLMNQPEARFYYKIHIPYDPSVKRGMRANHNGEVYHIQAATDIGGENEVQVLVCVQLG